MKMTLRAIGRLVERAGGRLRTCLRTGLPGRLRTTASLAAWRAVGTPTDQSQGVGEEQGGAERGDELEQHVVVEAHPPIVWRTVRPTPAGRRPPAELVAVSTRA